MSLVILFLAAFAGGLLGSGLLYLASLAVKYDIAARFWAWLGHAPGWLALRLLRYGGNTWDKDTLICTGPFANTMRDRAWGGVTLSAVHTFIWCDPERPMPTEQFIRLLEHEARHGEQAAKWGPLYLPAYLAILVYKRIRLGSWQHAYDFHPWELEANGH